MERDKIAFFDFCETLANFQTADAFVDFVRKKSNRKRMQLLENLQKVFKSTRIIYIIQILIKKRYPVNKCLKLYQLKGFSISEIDSYAKDYYYSVVKPNLIPRLIQELLQLKSEGWKIVLVSGGYDVYLHEFAKDYGVDDVISTSISFHNGVCTGRMNGPDCLGVNKVVLLDKLYKRDNIISKSFSDSISDIPFLRWTDESYVVSRSKSQTWADQYKFKEIIW